MTKSFIEIAAGKKAIECRKPLCGVGINDANYITTRRVNGKLSKCPFYARWKNIIDRCYSKVHQERYPTYKGCTVCDEWRLFSNFKSWMKSQKWEGMDIDKDIIKPGNKVYSPEFCRFVTRKLNMLINDSMASRGKYPQGVSFDKKAGKIRANISGRNTRQHLGYYETSQLAFAAYVKAKTKILLKAASEVIDPAIANGLRLHAILLSKKLNKHEGES